DPVNKTDPWGLLAEIRVVGRKASLGLGFDPISGGVNMGSPMPDDPAVLREIVVEARLRRFKPPSKPIARPQSGNGCKAPPISAAERAAAQRGDRSAFWNSRLAAGDPLAGTALGIVNNNTFSGQIANQILQSAVVAHSPTMHWQGVANEMQSIGVDIMRAHVGAIDRFGSPNTSQITDYHRDVFNAHGLPGSTFGGTAIFGSASLTNAITGWAGCRF
ncbi:MAG TPA: hypothetical protein PJ982_16570, partial [Lacipirellulaceae bacterium]|nr:hypothetical protein [Lacipirellulaceae bacterium]